MNEEIKKPSDEYLELSKVNFQEIKKEQFKELTKKLFTLSEYEQMCLFLNVIDKTSMNIDEDSLLLLFLRQRKVLKLAIKCLKEEDNLSPEEYDKKYNNPIYFSPQRTIK